MNDQDTTVQTTPAQPPEKRFGILRDIVGIIVFVVSVIIGALILNAFVFQTYNVFGPSMEPTLQTGDRLVEILERHGTTGPAYEKYAQENLGFGKQNWLYYIAKQTVLTGLADDSGNILLPPEYRYAYPISDKLAFVGRLDMQVPGPISQSVPRRDWFPA